MVMTQLVFDFPDDGVKSVYLHLQAPYFFFEKIKGELSCCDSCCMNILYYIKKKNIVI